MKLTSQPEKDMLCHKTSAVALGTWMKKLGMMPPLECTTPCSIDIAQQAEIDTTLWPLRS
jgi:hypothetical protein